MALQNAEQLHLNYKEYDSVTLLSNILVMSLGRSYAEPFQPAKQKVVPTLPCTCSGGVESQSHLVRI